MAKIKVNLAIPVPQAVVDAYNKVSYQIRKWAFQINPYHCSCCGKIQYVSHPHYSHTFSSGKTLTVQNLATDFICRECIVDELVKGTWDPRFTQMFKDKGTDRKGADPGWMSRRCAITGSSTRSYRNVEIVPYIDMIFADPVWNNTNVSKHAVVECVKYGKITTGHWGVWRKTKMAPMNLKGLFIDENGELL